MTEEMKKVIKETIRQYDIQDDVIEDIEETTNNLLKGIKQYFNKKQYEELWDNTVGSLLLTFAWGKTEGKLQIYDNRLT